MPQKGRGAGGNHDDLASQNMVKSIQAALGGLPMTGYFGDKTQKRIASLNSKYKGTIVGQGIVNMLKGFVLDRIELDMIWPCEGHVSSFFGNRPPVPCDDGTVSDGPHGGIDIGNYGVSVPITAAQDGVVMAAGQIPGYGLAVKIDHGNGAITIYGHLSPPGPCVVAGQFVSQGQPLGVTGKTGHAKGIHLHFEIRINGQRVDPLLYLPSK